MAGGVSVVGTGNRVVAVGGEFLAADLLPAFSTAHAAADADAVALTFVAAVVADIFGVNGGRLKAVFAFGFGLFGSGNQTAFEPGVFCNIHLETVVAGKQSALAGGAGMVGFEAAVFGAAAGGKAVTYGNLDFALVVFAVVNGGILRAGYAEALGIEVYAFAEYLRAFDGGMAAAADLCAAFAAAYAAVAVSGIVAVSPAFAVIAAGGNAQAYAAVNGNGNACIESCPAAAAAFLVCFLCGM
ncbi:hypothetical protein l11_03740 [Neisseria weaveri LMG 5135]|nr:hypothetical protein l11_03740 [Neisseria weaveri LMG 5135]